MKNLSKIAILLTTLSANNAAIGQSFPQPPITEEAPKTKAQLTKELNEAIKISRAGIAAYESRDYNTIKAYVYNDDFNDITMKYTNIEYEANSQGFTEIAETAKKWADFDYKLGRAMSRFLFSGNTEDLGNILFP